MRYIAPALVVLIFAAHLRHTLLYPRQPYLVLPPSPCLPWCSSRRRKLVGSLSQDTTKIEFGAAFGEKTSRHVRSVKPEEKQRARLVLSGTSTNAEKSRSTSRKHQKHR